MRLRMAKRVTSLLLALAMVMSLCPFQSFAQEATYDDGGTAMETVFTDDTNSEEEASGVPQGDESNAVDSSDDGTEADDADSNNISDENAGGIDGEDGVITTDGTPTANVTVNLANTFVEKEPVTIADSPAIYVSSGGDDTNGDGTQTSPYATISKAYTEAATGGTIYLLTDVDVSAQITFGTAKTVTITSADSSNVKTIYSKIQFGYDNKTMITVAAGEVVFKNITIDGTGQRQAAKSGFPDGVANSPCCIYAIKSGATATLDTGTTIQNFWKNNGTSGGSSVLKATVSGSQINIKDGVLITGCVLEAGNTDDPSSVLSSGTGATMCMTGGTVTGNTLSTTQSASTAIVNIGKMNNPHFWMTSGKITGNTINSGCAAVYMRGEASACDIQFGDTAYVYDNYVNGASGDQKNIYLKNDNNGSENDNVFVKLCSALTGDAKLGVYAEIIGIGTKVAQGTKESGTKEIYTPTGSTYTATIADTAYFVSDKATTAEILYCGGSEDTCGLLAHSTASPDHEKAIYLSTSPSVSASKGTEKDTIDATISRCASDATYVVLDKDMKPVTGKTLSGGKYVTDGDGTFKLSDADTTTTIGMEGLDKDNGPYTVMLVGTGGLSVDSSGKASTDNLTDIATVNIVNFAGENVSWNDGTTTFENGDFDIVTVPHNDQTGKANKSYTATPASGYSFVETNPIVASGNLGKATITDKTGSKAVSLEVPAYATTEKGTSEYSTVTLTGSVQFDLDVSLLDKTGGSIITTGKTYDSVAVDHTAATLPSGLTATYTWQKKNSEGEYEDISGNAAPSDAGSYNLKVVATNTSDSSVVGTQNLPFAIDQRELTVIVTPASKTYDGSDSATVSSATLSGAVTADAVSIDKSKITATFSDKNVGNAKEVTASIAENALIGSDASNYKIATVTANTADISQKEVGVTVNASNKKYDATTTAQVTVMLNTGDVVSGDSVSLDSTNMAASFENATVGDGKKVTVTGLTLSGDSASNYKLPDTIEGTANITKADGNGTVTLSGWTYGSTANIPVPASDTNGTDGVTYQYRAKDAAESDPWLDTAPTDAGNYTVKATFPANDKYSEVTAVCDFTIAPKEISATLTAEDKTYDGNTDATASAALTGVEDTDKDNVKATVTGAAFNSKDAADDKQVSATVSLSGSAAKNYTLSATTASTTASIEKKALAIENLGVADKTYDGTATATISTTPTLKDAVEGDNVTLTNGTPTFASPNAAQNIAINFTDFSLGGADAANYTLTQPTGITADIDKRELTITGASVTQKQYDGTDSATVTSVNFDGLQNGDMLTANTDYTISNAKYDGANATGEGAATKVDFDVALTDTTLANNYILKTEKGTQDSQTIKKANTTDKTASTSGTRGQENTFDMPAGYMVEGANIASITITQDANSILSNTPAYADGKLTYRLNSSAENGQSAITRLEITSQNYETYYIDITIGVDEKQEVTITIDDATLTYNATAQAPTNITVEDDLVPTDELVITYVGTGSTVYPESNTAPTDAGTYSMSVSVPDTNTQYKGTATKAFTISPKEISATLAAQDKTYDGNASATATATLEGVENTDKDNVKATVMGAAFDSKDAANGKQVSATVSLSGSAAKNYTLNEQTVSTTANITQREVTISGVAIDTTKVYDGNADVTITNSGTLNDVKDGDVVTIKTGTATYDNKNAGENKTVTFSGFELEGADANNYTLKEQPSSQTAKIERKALTVDVAVADKTYDGLNTASFDGEPMLIGVVEGEAVTLTNGTPTFSSVDVGENIAVNFTEFSISGTDVGNYTLTQPSNITANINAYNATGTEYTTTTKNWTNQDFVVTAAEGWQVSTENTADSDWGSTLTRTAETGNTSGSLTFYVKNTTTGIISEAITENYKIDKTAPTGTIRIGEQNEWQEFLSTISFSLFYKDEQSVTLTGNDTSSGLKTIEYLVTEDDLDIAQLANKTFTTYADAFDIEPDAKLIVYAKLTDNAGNVTYLRSDGVVLDATAPVINGADNGKTYCAAVTLTITDENLDRVTLNGETATLTDGKLTLNPAKGTQTVVATDKAGNSTSITVTVNDGHTWGEWTSVGDGAHHKRTCQFDATHTETGNCHGGVATCKDKAVCEDCKASYGELDPQNHTNLRHVEAKAATTVAEGNIEYWYCDGCDKYYKDADATKEITKADTVIAKLKPASTTNTSTKTGNVSTTNTSTKTGSNSTMKTSVKTGDDGAIFLWMILLLISGGVTTVTALVNRKKKHNR